MLWGYVTNQKDWLVDFTIKINILTSSKFIKIKKNDKLGAILFQYDKELLSLLYKNFLWTNKKKRLKLQRKNTKKKNKNKKPPPTKTTGKSLRGNTMNNTNY